MVEQNQPPAIDSAEETQERPTETRKSKGIKWSLVLLSSISLIVGSVGAPLLTRIYYLHGGSRKWLICSLSNVGFPVLFVPLVYLYVKDRGNGVSSMNFLIEPWLFLASAFIGLLMGVQMYTYSLALSYIPVSTFGILGSSQLVFTAGFAWLIVKQKFTPFSINSVVLMTIGAILLGMHSQGDRPAGVSNSQYLLGFFLTIGASILVGFTLPSIEFSYAKARKNINFATVLQFQLNLCLFGVLFGVIGMLINKDFQAIAREAKAFGLGKGMYQFVCVAMALSYQLSCLGLLGLLFLTTSLFTGILTCSLLPLVEVASVIAFHEKFSGEKGISLILALWGLTSYFYGEYRKTKQDHKIKSQAQQQEPSDV